MELNTIQPAAGSRHAKRRVGRGIGSGLGKTAGRGHKGQKSRSGGYHKVGFEGGQMPLQRRLPKRGFKSRKSKSTAELTLNVLDSIDAAQVDLYLLKQLGLISAVVKRVKVVNTGEINRALIIKNISVTAAAKEAIIASGGALVN